MATPRIVRSPFQDESEIRALGRCGFCLGCDYHTPCLTLSHTLQIFRKEQTNDSRALKHIHAAMAPVRRARVLSFLRRVIRRELGSVAERAAEWRRAVAEEEAWIGSHCPTCGKEAAGGDFCSKRCYYNFMDE